LTAVLSNVNICEQYSTHYQRLNKIRVDLEEQLNLLLEAWKRNDFVLISDILEYELRPIIEDFINASFEFLHEVA
jgi:hypothetical protein